MRSFWVLPGERLMQAELRISVYTDPAGHPFCLVVR